MLAGVRSIVLPMTLMKIGLKTAGMIGKVIELQCAKGERDNFRLGIELSYYMSIISPILVKQMLALINDLSLSDDLTWKVI